MAPTAPGPSTDQWLHRPDVWSGLFLAGALAGRSFQPSLMPRATAHQSLITGVTGALGFALGDATYGLLARTGSPIADLAVASGVAAGSFAASRALPESDGEAAWRPAVRTATSCLAAGSSAAAFGVAVRAVPAHRRRVAGVAVTVAALSTGARAVAHGLRAQRSAHTEFDPPLPKALPAVTQSVGAAAVLVTLGEGFRRSAGAIGRTLESRLGLPATPSRWLGRGMAAAVWYGTGKALADTFVRGLRLYDRVVDAGFDRAPLTPMRSSGQGSPIAFGRLGREGRRFVLNAPYPDEITAVMGSPATAEPIRVFVGYAAARTDEERVALAVEELRRTGAFDRSLLLVGCPAGNGYVNTLPLEVLDYVLGGDTAAVAVQYGRLPSFLTLQRVPRGGRVQRALLTAIAAELAGRAVERRPKVVCYGESLGAWSGQDTFLGTGVAGLDDLGVARALWAGTPYYSGWRREVLVDRTVAVPEGSVVQVDRPEALAELSADERARLRAVVLDHGNDPVCYLSAGLLVRTPPWLLAPGDERPWGVPRRMSWLPFITAVQVIVDAVNATRPVPGVFRATGHEYTADLPDVTLAAYGIEPPDPETWQRLVARLQELDAQRASFHKLPRVDDATTDDAEP
jgi:uncharacterized membrane protein